MRCIVRPVAPGPLFFLGLVSPPRLPFLLGIFSSPFEGLKRSIDDVGRQAGVVIESALDVEHGVVVFFVVGVEAVVARVAIWFEVYEAVFCNN